MTKIVTGDNLSYVWGQFCDFVRKEQAGADIVIEEALKEKGLLLRIYSDSSYLVNCFQQGWHKNWVKNGWKTSQKKPVENRELWEKLLSLK